MENVQAMPEVLLPSFPDRIVEINEFGAIGNGVAMNTAAFAQAIDTCSASGGGTVRIPPGIWRTGPIRLKNNVNLHAEAGAIVMFHGDLDDYPLGVFRYGSYARVRCLAPIDGEGLENIAITGSGIFDGGGEGWRPVKKAKTTESQWNELLERPGSAVQQPGNKWWPTQAALDGDTLYPQLWKAGCSDVEAYRPIRDYLRPPLVSLKNCRKVLLDGPTFQNSPFWCLHPLLCEHVTIRRIIAKNPWYAANGDGLDIDSCRYVDVSDSSFDVGDDGICLKSGKNGEGRSLSRPSEYISIRNCRVFRGHGGFVIGSEMSGGVRHVWVSDCTFIGTNAGLRFKSARGRGGIVENVNIRNIRMKEIAMEAITFNLYYQGSAEEEMERPAVPVTEETPRFRHIHIRDTVCIGAQQAIEIFGLPEMPVENIEFTNVLIRADRGVDCAFAQGLVFDNVDVKSSEGEAWSFNRCKDISFDGEKTYS